MQSSTEVDVGRAANGTWFFEDTIRKMIKSDLRMTLKRKKDEGINSKYNYHDRYSFLKTFKR